MPSAAAISSHPCQSRPGNSSPSAGAACAWASWKASCGNGVGGGGGSVVPVGRRQLWGRSAGFGATPDAADAADESVQRPPAAVGAAPGRRRRGRGRPRRPPPSLLWSVRQYRLVDQQLLWACEAPAGAGPLATAKSCDSCASLGLPAQARAAWSASSARSKEWRATEMQVGAALWASRRRSGCFSRLCKEHEGPFWRLPRCSETCTDHRVDKLSSPALASLESCIASTAGKP